jgi:hypothetical protein
MGVVSLGSASAALPGGGGGGGGGAACAYSAPPTLLAMAAGPARGATPHALMLERAVARAAPSARLAIASASETASALGGGSGGGSGGGEAEQQLRAAFCGIARSEMDGSADAAVLEEASALSRLSAPRAAGAHYQAVAPLAAQAAAGGAGEGGLDEAVEALRAQPASDADLAAGFDVFTTYLDKVTDIRGQALKVYEDAGRLLPQEGKAALAGSVAALDKAENLGIADPPPGQWIVYGMARKANSNHALISQLVHGLETKLALLQEEVDCPFCLDKVGTEGRATHIVPSCCHRACQECWQNWGNVCGAQGRAPFCPLCRGPAEFMAVLNP